VDLDPVSLVDQAVRASNAKSARIDFHRIDFQREVSLRTVPQLSTDAPAFPKFTLTSSLSLAALKM
jgi:hypothetical protein